MHHWRVVFNWLRIFIIFYACGFSVKLRAQSAADTLEQRIEKAIDQNRVIGNLGSGFQHSPSGEFLLAPANRDLKFGILIYNIDILPEKAVFSAAMAFRDPVSNQLVAFRCDNIDFSYSHGLTGPVNLFLLDSLRISLGNAVEFILIGGNPNETYAKFDCEGLQEFGIHGNAVFNQEVILAVDDTGAIAENKNVDIDFRCKAKNWGNWMVEVSLPPFQFSGWKGFVFRVENAVLDLSESHNASGMQFPKSYSSLGLLSGCENTWQGFFMRNLRVTLPKYFQNQGKEPLSFGVQNCIIDEFGFSGNVYAENILSFEKGNLGGWNLSIQKLDACIQLNHLVSNRISGEMGMPVLPDTSRLSYLARIDYKGDYLFSISTKGNFRIPALKASEILLQKNSFITAEIKGNRTFINAELHGKFTISANNEPEALSRFRFPEIVFRGLKVSNGPRKFDIDYLGMSKSSDSLHCLNFPVQLQSIFFSGKGDDYCIESNFSLNLTEYASANCGIKVYCNSTTENSLQRLRFKALGISSASVAFEKAGIHVAGKLDIFKEDEVYGNGFNGNIEFRLCQPRLSAKASALFGNIHGTRYWYFDAEASWPEPGIALSPGLNINGFAGGAWHRLKPWDGRTTNEHPEYGRTASGIVLVPDKLSGLGLKAGVFLNGGVQKSYVAKAILEFQFSKSIGIDQVLFYGDMEIMPGNSSAGSKPSSLIASIPQSGTAWKNYCAKYNPKTAIGGPVMMQLDFKNKNFFAASALYLKQAAGNTINGANKNYLAGEFGLFFNQQRWYLRAGTPDHPIAANISIAKQDLLKAKMYFMAGHDLLPAPPPPAEITQALGNHTKLDASRNLSALASGSGFAFGTSLEATAGASGSDGKISAYARLRALVAADLNLENYGNATCRNKAEPLGIHGWYAQGNWYTFLQGKIGASVGKFNFDVMSFTAAMALSAAGPNPAYASGNASLEFRLTRLFTFKGNLKMEIGEACETEKKRALDSSIIVSVTPQNNAKEMDPLTEIKLEFAVPIGQVIEGPDGKRRMFRIRKILLSAGGKEAEGSWSFDEKGYQCFHSRRATLLPNTEYQLHIEIDLVEVDKKGNKIESSEAPLEEIKTFVFQTGKSSEIVPVSNIRFAYPSPGQINFYKSERSEGFVQLKVAQDEVLQVSGSKIVCRFKAADGSLREYTASYKYGKIGFSIPRDLKPGMAYCLQLLRVDQNYQLKNQGANENTSGGMNSSQMSMDGTSQKTNFQKPKLLLEYYFRTSVYGTFKEKVNDFRVKATSTSSDGEVRMELVNASGEYFEPSEITVMQTGISLSADLNNSNWYSTQVKSRAYNIFGDYSSKQVLSRDTGILGLSPIRAISLEQENVGKLYFGKENFKQRTRFSFSCTSVVVNYSVPKVVGKDVEEIREFLFLKNGMCNSKEQVKINKYAGLYSGSSGRASTGTSSAAGQKTVSGQAAGSASKAASASTSGEVIGAIPILSLKDMEKIKLLFPAKGENIPIIWIYRIPGNAQHKSRVTISFKL